MDRMGLQFMEDKESLDAEESLELLSDLFGVEKSEMYDHFTGREFVPRPKLEM